MTLANPTDKAISLPFFFHLSEEGWGSLGDFRKTFWGILKCVARTKYPKNVQFL